MSTAVVVFAREPEPGRVKTRLAAGIGENAASRVYIEMLDHTLHVVQETGFDVVVSLAENPSPTWWGARSECMEVQCGSSLGARMLDAFERRFSEGYDRAVIVGSDCPLLRAEHIRGASDALDESAVALGPAADGGYWLVAQRRPGVDLFSEVPWSSRETMPATRRRLEEMGIGWVELEILDDVDTEGDLRAALADPRVSPDLRCRLLKALESHH